MTDIAIARQSTMRPIADIGEKLGIPVEQLHHFGSYKAKVSYDFIKSLEGRPEGKLILVTAITPTPAGEGKTPTTVGLGDALNKIGKKATICIREPSLGPCFGMKGGAAGGGYAQVVPMEDINLHFTGDFHAIGIVATIRALKMHGGGGKGDLDTENVAAVREGIDGLDVEVIDCKHWADGSDGTNKLAQQVVQMADACTGQFVPLYDDPLPLWDKVKTVATKLYGAENIIADKMVRGQFTKLQRAGYGHLPVCIAKTQYSFSTDPNLKGAPSGHVVPVRDVRLSAGAGFVVVVCGDIMTMPGLPRVPAANSIHLNKDGQIEGLF